MFDVFLDNIKKLLKSRIFPITLIYLVLLGVIVNRLFVIQIVNGPEIDEKGVLRDTKKREIESTRGNIYDRNGNLLASNALTYSVVMEDSTKIESNEQKNAIIYKLIKLIEKNGDTLDNDFFIAQDKEGNLKFTIEGAALLRFKKDAYAYAIGKGELTEEQKNATAEEVYEFLRSGKGFEDQVDKMFDISDSYSVIDTLKIMSVRFALHSVYPKYLQINVASNVSDLTIAAVEENSDELIGVEVKQQTHRIYEDSIYFSNIIGYTGLISSEELEEKNKKEKLYNLTDVIGKTGLEKKFEEYLRGKKGTETVSVNSANKVTDIIDHIDPAAGNDIYLTIDRNLQISTYHLLEKELAAVLLEYITPDLNYGSKGESATDILIPIYEVYYALINNNIIDINHFNDKKATALEKQTYDKYKNRLKEVFQKLDTLLKADNTVTNTQAVEMKEYLDYFYSVLVKNNILITNAIPKDDPTLLDYQNGKISLSSFLQYALANNWVDLSELKIGNDYYSANELYQKLIAFTKNILKSDSEFNKKIYRDLVFSYKLSGSEICLLLFDQGVLKYKEEEVTGLKNNSHSAYTFITEKIKALEITPAMLALSPCSGSVVITDVNTGDVRALVTYPGYDNNKFAGRIDAEYYNQIHSDLSYPWMNRPTTQKIAPGSTFKMVTSVAALEEGVTTPSYEIYDEGEFSKIDPAPKCHVYPGTHGSVNIIDALAVSCNYYFFEMGWRLSIDGAGKYNTQKGLSNLKKYAALFGLNQKSGLDQELGEAEPMISDKDSVRSAIGQGSNAYTPDQMARYVTTLANRGTCYDLTLVDKITAKDDTVIEDRSAKVNHKLSNVNATTWDAVLEGMHAVVNSPKGSVYSTFKNFGVEVAGKTGTSQISKSIPNNALFVSFAPYNNPEISVTVVIPNGYTSHNAADLAKNLYSLYFNLEDEETLLNSDITVPKTNIDAAIE